ncbi:HtaA domain-containing protein [Leucobacter soli]|uniref:HtaA domain-containing protein n=1 Tax=Leucobacter soli TaxID=2812850 RepID=UPI003614F7AF
MGRQGIARRLRPRQRRGTAIPADGATEPEPGLFAFGLAESVPERLSFAGNVHLRGHGGMLDLPIASPALQRDADGWFLSIADPDEAPESGVRIVFARVERLETDPAGHPSAVLLGTGVTLTEDGAMLFFGPYQHGTPLADLRVVGLPADEADRISAP